MAIGIDSNSPQNIAAQQNAGASFNLTIGSGVSNPVLYVVVTVSDSGSPYEVTSVTYNSVAMQQVAASDPASGAGLIAYLFRLKNPTADGAPHAVAVTLQGTPSSSWDAGAVCLTGVDQTTPEDVSGANQTSSAVTTLSVPLSTNFPNDWYIVGGTDQGGFSTLALGDGATQRWYTVFTGPAGEHIGGTKILTSPGSISPTITVGQGGCALAMVAAAIKAAPSGQAPFFELRW